MASGIFAVGNHVRYVFCGLSKVLQALPPQAQTRKENLFLKKLLAELTLRSKVEDVSPGQKRLP